MKRLKDIIDTWNMLEKFNIENYNVVNGAVEITDDDFQKMLDGCKNKKYINNLLAYTGRVYGRGDF